MNSESIDIRKGIIMYFVTMPIYFLLGSFIHVPLKYIFSIFPLSKDLLMSIFFIPGMSILFPLLVLGLIMRFLWKKWKKPKYFIYVIILVFLSYYFRGYLFELYSWVIFGVGALSYGYFTGILRQKTTNNIDQAINR